jgi:hypothetical protein
MHVARLSQFSGRGALIQREFRQFGAVVTMQDRRERVDLGTVDVASIMIWLRDPVPDL